MIAIPGPFAIKRSHAEAYILDSFAFKRHIIVDARTSIADRSLRRQANLD